MANQHYASEFYDKAAPAHVLIYACVKKANVCPFSVRLAWHSSGTDAPDGGGGGSDGATMRFEPEVTDGANAGLALMQDILKPVKEKFPDLSYADLWTMAGTQAIALTGGPRSRSTMVAKMLLILPAALRMDDCRMHLRRATSSECILPDGIR
jgi:hypothetical protein